MNDINGKIDKFERKEITDKLRHIGIGILIIVIITFLVFLKVPRSSIEIETVIIGSTVIQGDLGNIVKLQIQADNGNFYYATLPKRSVLKVGSTAIMLEGTTFFGTKSYRFIRYAE